MMAATMPNPAHAIPERRLICRVCEKQYSKYTCPQCNLRYCSLACYKNHSLRCTESFMRNNVMEEMRDIQATKESQQNMLEALKRIRMDEDGRSIIEDETLDVEGMEVDDNDGGHGTVFSDRMLELIAEGGDISLDDLSVEERKDFLRALAAGEISHLIQPWYPWWLNSRAETISITTNGTSLIQPLHPSEEQIPKQVRTEASEAGPGEVPAPPSEALAQVRQLIRGDPSPSIPVQLSEVIYSYCFTLRFCNGDWQSEPLDAALILLSASQVLDQAASPESIAMALADAVKTICSPTFRHAGGFKFAIALFDDASAVLRLGRACVVCALADVHRMLENAKKQLKAELVDQKEVKLKHEIISKPGGTDHSNSRSTVKEKQSMGSGAIQNSSGRVATEQHSDGTTFADLRKMRDRRRDLIGNKKHLSTENDEPNSSSNASQISRDGTSGNSSKQRKTSVELKQITAAVRKIYFLMCWTNEQPMEIFSSLALLVDAEKERLLELDDLSKHTGLGIMQEVKVPVTRSGPIIEEIVEK